MTEAEKIPLVSVCIQTFQHADYIKECLDSVLKQETDFPFEIIIGEDDSTDGTRAICIEYASLYPEKIKLFLRSEKDKIFIQGEKTGRFNFIGNLKAARGKYIALLDGDDYWITTHKLQRQVDFMEVNATCSLSFHRSMQRRGNSEPFQTDSGIAETDSIFSIDYVIKQTGIFTIHTSNCMLRREHLLEIPGWFYETPFLDFPIYLYTGQKGKIGFIAELLSVYRVHQRGMWLSNREPMNYIKMWRLYTIMARNINGETGEILLARRSGIGNDLVSFYKNHLWEKRDWLITELEKQEFQGDENLLKQIKRPPRIKNYFFNIGSFSKKIVRGIVKRR